MSETARRHVLRRWRVRTLLAFAACLLLSPYGLTPAVAGADAEVDVRAIERELGVVRFTLHHIEHLAAEGGEVQLALPLGEHQYDVVLSPHAVLAPEFRLIVGDDRGLTSVAAPPVATYRGRLPQAELARVAATVRDGQLDALILLEGRFGGSSDAWFVQPLSRIIPGAGPGLHIIYAAADAPADGNRCGGTLSVPHGARPVPPGAVPGGTDSGQLVGNVAIDADYAYYVQNGSSISATTNDVNTIMNSVSLIYEADANVRFQISELIIRTTNWPYASGISSPQLLTGFRSHWNANHAGVQRHIAHLFTGITTTDGYIGYAYIDVVCATGWDYGFSRSRYTSNMSRRVGLHAHEIGHNFSARHCNQSPTQCSPCNIMCSTIGGCTGNTTSFGCSTGIVAAYAAATPCLASGACCLSSGSCAVLSEAQCAAQNGAYQGHGGTCATATCSGACCFFNGDCIVMGASQCAQQNGVYRGDGADCAEPCALPPAGEWIVRAPAPSARHGAAGAMVGHHFYLLGGQTTSGLERSAFRYSLRSNLWEQIADIPHSGTGNGGVTAAAAAAVGDSVYLVGGWDGIAPMQRVLAYDIATNTWGSVTWSLAGGAPPAVSDHAVVAHDNRLYVIGGIAAGGALRTDTHIYHIIPQIPGTRPTWSTAPGPPTPRRFLGAALVQNRIYAAGGVGAGLTPEYDIVELFNPSTGVWSAAPAMSAPRGGAGLYNWDGEPYAVGGGWGIQFDATEVLRGTSWAGGPQTNSASRSFACAGSSEWLVKAGGWSWIQPVATLEVFRMSGAGSPPCYANCDGSTTEPILTVDDFTCFINEFATAQGLPHEQQIVHYANCDGSTTAPALTVDDFTCFINAFASGCP